jgi:hypothetical protein
VQRWFVAGVVAAGLVLSLVLPLGAGSEGFPALVDCLSPSGLTQCQEHVSGTYPAGSVLYRLQAEVSSHHGHTVSLSQFNLGPDEPLGLILCLRPGRPVFSCVRVEKGQPVLHDAPTMLGMYVDAQFPPAPGP